MSFRGYLYIAAAALCWAASAGLGKAVFTSRSLLFAHPIPPLDAQILSQTRVTFSFLILAALLLIFRGPRSFRVPAPVFRQCLLLGVLGFAGSNFFYYFAIEKTAVSTAIIVQYTAPAWVLLYMVARRHQRATWSRSLSVAAAIFGCALAVGLFTRGVSLVWIGVLSALLAAFSFSFFIILGRSLVTAYDHWIILLYGLLGASLFWLIVHNPLQVAASHYSRAQWLFMLIFAFTSMLVPQSLYFAGLRYLDPTRAVVTSCLEPVFTILIAALALGETFAPIQAIGMAIVLAATIAIQLPQKQLQIAD